MGAPRWTGPLTPGRVGGAATAAIATVAGPCCRRQPGTSRRYRSASRVVWWAELDAWRSTVWGRGMAWHGTFRKGETWLSVGGCVVAADCSGTLGGLLSRMDGRDVRCVFLRYSVANIL